MDGGFWSVHGPFLVERVEVNLKLSLLSPVGGGQRRNAISKKILYPTWKA
jgi:hypothetical protein